MGRDNHPRFRRIEQVRRRRGRRNALDRILIVCEGEKTEPNYFEEIRQGLRLPSANIRVYHEHTNPLRMVEDAEQVFINGAHQIQKRSFEQICIVFDRDDHDHYIQALQKTDALNNKKYKNDSKSTVNFTSYPSVPCFELWLLLHFEEILAPLQRQVVYQRLRQHIPNYNKGDNDLYARTNHLLSEAHERAKTLARQRNGYDEHGPYTGISELVIRLQRLGGR